MLNSTAAVFKHFIWHQTPSCIKINIVACLVAVSVFIIDTKSTALFSMHQKGTEGFCKDHKIMVIFMHVNIKRQNGK